MKRTARTAAKRTLAISTILVITIAGVAFWLHRAPATNDIDPLVTAIQKELTSKFKEYRVTLQPWSAENAGGTNESVSGYDYRVSSATMPDLEIASRTPINTDTLGFVQPPATGNDEIASRITYMLNTNDFQLTKSSHSLSGLTTDNIFARGHETCSLHNDKSSYALSLHCTSPALLRQAAAAPARLSKLIWLNTRIYPSATLLMAPLLLRASTAVLLALANAPVTTLQRP
jgi:hypothetical protein